MVRRVETEIPLGETITLREDTNTGNVPFPRPLIFLHGALGSREQMLPVAGLFRSDRPVFAPDFSGHGRVTGVVGEFSIERFTGDLVAFLDREGIARADLFGFSMGGYVGLHAARFNPGRIGSIMTLGTKFAWDETTAGKEASRLEPAVIEEKVPAFAARLKELHGRAWTDVVRSTARMMLELGTRPALSDGDFQSIPHRALLTVGERDEMVTVRETEKTAGLLPAGTSRVFPDMGHPIERADRGFLAGAVSQFFSAGKTSSADSPSRSLKTSIGQNP